MKCPLLPGNIHKETDRETEKSMLWSWGFIIPAVQTHCPKVEMNEEKPSKFQFQFPVFIFFLPGKESLISKNIILI